MSKFEDFLMEKHAEDYIGTDDDMPDAFNAWLGDVSVDDWVEYGDEFAKKINTKIFEQLQSIIKAFEEGRLNQDHISTAREIIAKAEKVKP